MPSNFDRRNDYVKTTRPDSSQRRGHNSLLVIAIVSASLVMLTEAAFGLGFSVTQIGGTAVNGRGQIGDTVIVSVNFVIGQDELITGVFPTLRWDEKGGNVLDVVSAIEDGSATLGAFPFNRINSNYLLWDGPSRRDATVLSFSNGIAFDDSQVGSTYLQGFESIFSFSLLSEEQLTALIENGAPGAGSIHMGEITFRLSGLGATSIGFFVNSSGDNGSSLVVGPKAFTYTSGDIESTDLPVSAIGLGTFQIVVVPEPSMALMIGLGLAGLASKRRHF